LLLRELAQVTVAGGAQHLEAFFLDRFGKRADAQARGVLGAVVFVDDDDRKAKAQHGRAFSRRRGKRVGVRESASVGPFDVASLHRPARPTLARARCRNAPCCDEKENKWR